MRTDFRVNLLFVPHIDDELDHRQRFFRIHPTNRRVAVSRRQHRAVNGQDKFSRLNKVAPFIPPGAKQITIGASYAMRDWKAERLSNLRGFFFRIHRTRENTQAQFCKLFSERFIAV